MGRVLGEDAEAKKTKFCFQQKPWDKQEARPNEFKSYEVKSFYLVSETLCLQWLQLWSLLKVIGTDYAFDLIRFALVQVHWIANGRNTKPCLFKDGKILTPPS